jgi:OmcA/MtrC family decaheme c-type cytochrome
MIHRIHRGANLPTVQAGIPYQIIGFGGRVHDYSDVHFPQDIRNCETCHVPGPDVLTEAEIASKVAAGEIVGGTQSSNWNTQPTRDTCDSCHNDISFVTGIGHPGGVQLTDDNCSTCHQPQGAMDFDASIRGAHTVPRKSTLLKGINIEILGVANTTPGQSPTVNFNITENDGTVIAPDSLPFFNMNLVGPTTDYSTLIRESATGAVPVDGGYTYTFAGTIPADAVGTFAVGAEAFRMVTLSGSGEHRETEEENPVFYFSVDGSTPVPRRTVVQEENCNKCHNKLELHGTIRHDPEYCVTCHIPSGDDGAQRPAEELPVQSRHFKFMIHRIHTGSDLERDFTIYGFNGSRHNYNELHFPGDRRDCETCHVNDSYELPLPENLLPTPTPREFYNPLLPIAGACLGCHDSESTAAHAFTMTSSFGEACVACHGEGKDFAVSRVHAR